MIENADHYRLSVAPLFAAMAPAELALLGAGGEVRLIAKGEEVEAAGEDALLVLLSGAIALSVQEGDRAAILSTVGVPQALNLACVVARASCQVRWRALEACAVFILPGGIFRAALARDADLATRAYGELAIAYQQLLTSAAGQRLQTAQRRLASYLLSLAAGLKGAAVVQLPYEKHLLASLLGMTPENFSRALGRLSDYGVSVRGADVSIGKVERLRAALGAM